MPRNIAGECCNAARTLQVAHPHRPEAKKAGGITESSLTKLAGLYSNFTAVVEAVNKNVLMLYNKKRTFHLSNSTVECLMSGSDDPKVIINTTVMQKKL